MFDLHTHSRFSDGKNTAREMVESAIEKGFKKYGLSEHSHCDWDVCGMTPEVTNEYRAEMEKLKKEYAGKIEIVCGLERDYYSDDELEYDYVIGSVHAVMMPDGHAFCVDWEPEKIEKDIQTYFAGDWYALAEEYFRVEADVVRKTKCDIIGHFDLVSKYNEQRGWFDAEHPRYRAAWKAAADALILTGKPFEINTGAISRGYRTDAYPSKEIRAYLREKGAKMILSSDAHQKENIGFEFERFQSEI